MSQLEPGQIYIYERVDGRVYARRPGETERILIGEDYNIDTNSRRIKLMEEWLPILEAADQNAALQDSLERVKIIYELGKKENTIFHHPV